MPPPSLSTTTTVSDTSRSAAPSRALVSWRKARSPTRATVGRPLRATPDRRGHHAVDPVGAPVGQHPGVGRCPPNHSTSRIGMDEATTRSASAGSAREHGCGPRRARPPDLPTGRRPAPPGRRRRPSARSPATPAAPACGRRRQEAGHEVVSAARSGSANGAGGVDDHLDSDVAQPRGQHLRRRAGRPSAPRRPDGEQPTRPRSGSRRSKPAITAGVQAATPLSGSASTGQPDRLGDRRTIGRIDCPGPPRSRPADRPRALDDGEPASAPETAWCHGAPSARPSGSRPGLAQQRLAEGQVQVHGPRPRPGGVDAGPSGQRAPRPRRALPGHARLDEGTNRPAVET